MRCNVLLDIVRPHSASAHKYSSWRHVIRIKINSIGNKMQVKRDVQIDSIRRKRILMGFLLIIKKSQRHFYNLRESIHGIFILYGPVWKVHNVCLENLSMNE